MMDFRLLESMYEADLWKITFQEKCLQLSNELTKNRCIFFTARVINSVKYRITIYEQN